MRNLRFLLLLFFCLTVSPSAPRAQTQAVTVHANGPAATQGSSSTSVVVTTPNPKTPAEFFARARQLSDLEASGISFHLKATFVATGSAEFKGNGVYEEWWEDKDHWRKEATLGDFRYVSLKNGDGNPQVYTTSNFVPARLHQAVDDVLIRIPTNAVTSGKWKIQRKKLKGVELISLGQRNACMLVEPDSEKCVQQLLFNPEGILRIEAANGVNTTYNSFVPFKGLLIPRKILTGYTGQDTNLVISIDVLEQSNANSALNLAEVPVGLPEFHSEALKPLEIGGQVKPPRSLGPSGWDHTYEGPRSIQPESRVVLDLIIDTHGKVTDAHIVHSGGRKFDDAALVAARRPSFAPATLHGVPVPVKMRVVIDFHKY